MPKPKKTAEALRREAEERLRGGETNPPDIRTDVETQRLVHELQVHQVELEMQNEELLRAREELEAGMERFVDLYDFAPVGYLTLDCKGIIRQANLAAAGLLGMDRAPLNGLLFGRFVPKAARLAYNALLTATFAGAGNASRELAIVNARKEHLYLQVSALAAKNGRESRLVLVNITERVRAEEALRQSEATYRIVADNTYDWEFWIDPRGRFLYCSPSCERITGHKPEEFMADPGLLARLIHPDDRAEFERHRPATGEQCATGEWEWRFVGPEGSWRWVGHVCQRVYDDQGAFLGFRGSNRDITTRKQAEEALHKAHAELEQRVQERTAELAETVEELHDQIRERTAAEQALRREHRTLVHLLQARDRERQTISLGIHDNLTQPLTSATMHLQAAEGLKADDPEASAEAQSAGIAMLRESINEARRLIDGVRPPILEDEGVEAAIAHLACEPRGPDAPRVEFDIDARFDRLDPGLENTIYRIAQEGIDNARKYSQSDRIRIELVQQGDRLRIEIRDWGIGFDPQAIKEEAFGLEEIRERARLLGGTASIESAPGKGTRIVADLPLRSEKQATT